MKRVLHGPEPTGIVPRIVPCDAHGWSRRSLAVAGVTPSGGLDLWLARLDDFGLSGFPSDATVATDGTEAARAARIADPLARSRHLVSRALLRGILAQHLRCAPGALRFAVSAHGKPVLIAPEPSSGATPSLHFNLSHAGGWLLIATRTAGPVGVDLEFPRAGLDPDRLAGRVFTPTERAELRQAAKDSEAAARRRFYDGWTRKEALLKCLGTGFVGGASSFEVGTGRHTVRVATPGHGAAAAWVTSVALPEMMASDGQGTSRRDRATPDGPSMPGEVHAAVAWASCGPEQDAGEGPDAEAVSGHHCARHWLEPAA
jgi:4'-phosphopantetheinyl transferase